MRLDLFLLQKGMVSSRTRAQELISKGHVYLLDSEKKITLSKASYEVTEACTDKIFLEGNELQKFVSRAGLKLEGALRRTQLRLSQKKALDIGQSTGGFTDCLLQNGIAEVVGVDVGHGQLSHQIREDQRVIFFENLNVKNLKENAEFLQAVPPGRFDLIVADVSFISVTKIIPALPDFLSVHGKYLLLVKPQFECGADRLDKNGIVNDESVYSEVRATIVKCCEEQFGVVSDYFESALPGKDGNREFFIYGHKSVKNEFDS